MSDFIWNLLSNSTVKRVIFNCACLSNDHCPKAKHDQIDQVILSDQPSLMVTHAQERQPGTQEIPLPVIVMANRRIECSQIHWGDAHHHCLSNSIRRGPVVFKSIITYILCVCVFPQGTLY